MLGFDANANSEFGKSRGASGGQLSIDQQLQLMQQINQMVKAAQFSPQLAQAIYSLCQALKASGQVLEQTHKAELNKVFVSLRQACCRDAGQLGTPCRLKIMELVELRAMHWRTNLAHSQYYVGKTSREETSLFDDTPCSLPSTGGLLPTPPMPPQHPFGQQAHTSLFGQQHEFQQQQQQQQQLQQQQAGNGFYLIPTAGWPPIMPGLIPGMGGPLFPFNPAAAAAAEVLMRQKSIKKPSTPRTLQLRHEMIIRNCDSGKIMGVKGRRVALVEAITNTVISFQKVDSKSRERTLTITASSMEAIEHAKQLIEDTIRRNMSPVRSDAEFTPTTRSESIAVAQQQPEEELEGESDDEEEEPQEDISIETTHDGILKLTCSDPQVLAAAQEALSEYLRVRARPSAEERELKKNRRRSMPLQQPAAPVEQVAPAPAAPLRRHAHGGSHPNLQDSAVGTEVIRPRQRVVVPSGPRYDREDMVRLSRIDDLSLKDRVAAVAPEILR